MMLCPSRFVLPFITFASIVFPLIEATSSFKEWGYQLGVSFEDNCGEKNLTCMKHCYHVSTVFAHVISCDRTLAYKDKCGIALKMQAATEFNVEHYGCVPCKDLLQPDNFNDLKKEIKAKTLLEIDLNKQFYRTQVMAYSTGRLWLDVTASSEHGWFSDVKKNQQCLQIATGAKGLFTSWHDHADILGKEYDVSKYDIWYRHPLGIGDDSFNIPPMDDYRMFGGAKTAQVKRYAQDATLCRTKLNFESYIPAKGDPPTKWW